MTTRNTDYDPMTADTNVKGWRKHAACRGENPDRWAPWGVGAVDLEALATCNECPVREECHQAAHDEGWTASIHGGQLPHTPLFSGARVTTCGYCSASLVIGIRAGHTGYCSNRCRMAARRIELREEAGEHALALGDAR